MLKNLTTFLFRTVFVLFFSIFTLFAHARICIVIPAYNEETRLKRTLETYAEYFKQTPEKVTFLVVANNCSDKTVQVAYEVAKKYKNIEVMDIQPGGKGLALKHGWQWAVKKNFDLIGFVDADMATLPEHFYELVVAMQGHDGAIASRYIKGAVVSPSRPWSRKLGGKLYNWILRARFGLPYKDTQCGAKIFTKDTMVKVVPLMQEIGWSFDLELLYLCKLFEKDIVEVPTTWSDQPGSHLQITSKLAKEFLNSPKRIKQRHKKKKQELKHAAKLKKQQKKKHKKKKN
jgi:glycosyltransferase involved in cell wall biosynthesis